MKTLTYGVLPEFNVFYEAFIESTGGTYAIRLSDADVRMFESIAALEPFLHYGRYSCIELYDLLETLYEKADEIDGEGYTASSWASEFASSILSTLGFGWI